MFFIIMEKLCFWGKFGSSVPPKMLLNQITELFLYILLVLASFKVKAAD